MMILASRLLFADIVTSVNSGFPLYPGFFGDPIAHVIGFVLCCSRMEDDGSGCCQ